MYSQKRSLCIPVLLFDGTRCLVCLGATPATTLAKEDLSDGLLYLMGYCYALHLTYPKVCGNPSLCHSDTSATGHYP